VFVSPTRSKAVTSGREKGIVSAVASGHSIRTVAERYRRSIEDVISILESAA
jgi:transposase